MYRPRVMPVLLLRNLGLVKSIQFKDHRYIGDPINAVKIFNDLKADELVFLDINASNEKRNIPLDFVRKVGNEANMPFSVGGGIRSIDNIRDILHSGAEKVIINTYAVENPEFIRLAADAFGSSTIVVCIDVKRKLFTKEQTWTNGGRKNSGFDPVSFAIKMQEMGAGELIIQSIDHDGTMAGYNFDLIKNVSQAVTIPVVALGGAGNNIHLRQAVKEAYASASAAGSLFVYHGPRHAVLINFPTQIELSSLFQ